MKHELEELADMVAGRCGVDVAKTEWTEYGLLVVVRANGLVPMFCGETLDRDVPAHVNVSRLMQCADRAIAAAREYEAQHA